MYNLRILRNLLSQRLTFDANMSVLEGMTCCAEKKSAKTALERLYSVRNYSQQTTALSQQFIKSLTYNCNRNCHFRQFYNNLSLTTPHESVNIAANEERDNRPDSITENSYATKLFSESTFYAETLMKPFTVKVHVSDDEVRSLLMTNWSLATTSELLTALRKLAYHALIYEKNVHNEDYNSILQALQSKCNAFSKTELMDLLRYLVPLKEHFGEYKPYKNLYQKLDTRCKMIINRFSRAEIFVTCDIFYKLYGTEAASSSFIWNGALKLGSKPKKLSPKNLVQLCFLINICRKTQVNMYNLEYRLEQCIDDITINELGIVAMGFFKSRTQFRNPALTKTVMEILMRNLDNVDNVPCGCLFKIFRYSTDLTQRTTFRFLLEKLTPYIPKITLMSLLHVGHTCARVLQYDNNFLTGLSEKFQNEIEDCRLKDMERAAYIFSTFNYNSDYPIYHQIIQELEKENRKLEISKHKHVLPYLLQYLSYVNLYPHHLLEIVMDKKYMYQLCKNNTEYLTREYLVLDYGLRIDDPSYTGPFLTDKIRSFLVQKYDMDGNVFAKKIGRLHTFINDVVFQLKEILGSESDIYVGQLLPHIQSEQVVIGLDKDNKYVSAKPTLSSYSKEDFKHVRKNDSDETKYVALVFEVYPVLLESGIAHTGCINMQLRHLKKLGFTPVLLDYRSWAELGVKTNVKREFLQNVIACA